MQTGFLTMDINFNPQVIRNFQKAFFQPILKKFIQAWASYTYEKGILLQIPYSIKESISKRKVFGPMFWTFYFWIKYTQFKKTRRLPPRAISEKSFVCTRDPSQNPQKHERFQD